MMDWELTGKIVWLIFVAVWIVIRWVPHRRSRKTEVEVTIRTFREKFSMAFSAMGMGIIPVIWIFSGFPDFLDFNAIPAVIVIGAIVSLYSLYLFRKTHKALGAMWAFSLDIRKDHTLVTSGIYEKVRHPMYSAFWLWAVAQSLLLTNWLAALSAFIGFGALYFMRVGQEEAMMRQEFGEEYDRYTENTGRIFPKLR
ncbi:isoprenylcysteine carboxylmethyltransferase family protein [Ahrensia sp. AH-315-G08]|nr:isoprenylcysteine carboxylmethyltransferase family protein [Ahrensia sp. AH-315-G08]